MTCQASSTAPAALAAVDAARARTLGGPPRRVGVVRTAFGALAGQPRIAVRPGGLGQACSPSPPLPWTEPTLRDGASPKVQAMPGGAVICGSAVPASRGRRAVVPETHTKH